MIEAVGQDVVSIAESETKVEPMQLEKPSVE